MTLIRELCKKVSAMDPALYQLLDRNKRFLDAMDGT